MLISCLCFSNNDKQIIVALSLNDCVNCTISLHKINKILDNPKITFVFKSELEADSLLVNKRTGVYDFKQSVVVYSDSLFNEYTNGIFSTINVVENNEKKYSAVLYGLNVDEFINIFLSKVSNKCINNLKKGVQYIQDANSILINNNQLNYWIYYNCDNNIEIDITPDDSWVEKAYDIFFNNDQLATVNFKEFKNLLTQYPNIAATISKIKKIDNNEIAMLINIKFIETNFKTKNINIVQRIFLGNFDLNKRILKSLKYLNSEDTILDKYSLNSSDFQIINTDSYIIPLKSVENPTSESKYLSIFQVNKKNNNELIVKEVINSNIPESYIKYNLNNNFHNYCFDNSLIYLKFGNYLYDYSTKKNIKIPFKEEEYNSLKNIYEVLNKDGKFSTFYNIDIADNNKSILLLYKDSSKNLKLMEIDKKTEKAIKDVQLLSSTDLDSYNNKSSFTLINNKVYYLNNENCITILE